jgi:proteasome lid subunit RPN8/RPN11
MRQLLLPDALAARLLLAAADAYPSEACGLVEGSRERTQLEVREIHQTANVADETTRRFLVDPAAQIALMRSLRESDSDIIGCFHSHPDGVPEPSETDRAAAMEDGFVWLIAGGNPHTGFTLRGFVFEAGSKSFTPLAISG